MARRGKGDGSVFYDKSAKTWVGSLVIGYRDGKPVRRKVTAPTKGKCSTRLRELRAKVDAGDVVVGRPYTVEEWLRYWVDKIAPKRCVPSTIAGYESKIDQYIVPLLGHYRLDRLTPELVEQAWEELEEVGNPVKGKRGTATPLKPGSVLQAHRVLSRALTVAVQRQKVSRNVCKLIDAPSAGHAEIQSMSRDEARAVLITAEGRRNAARWTVALSLGLRQGEALGLQWPDVDLDDGVLRVRRALARLRGEGLVMTRPKSRSSERDIALPAQLLAELREHRAAQNTERLAAGDQWDDSDLVFCQANGKPIDPRSDWKAWRGLLVDAGVDHPYRLHDARHTAATLLMLQGIQQRVVMDILGHSQIGMTARYQHVVDEMQVAAAARMGAALWGEG